MSVQERGRGECRQRATKLEVKYKVEYILDDQQIAISALQLRPRLYGRVSFFPYSHQPSMDEPPSPLLKSRIPRETVVFDGNL